MAQDISGDKHMWACLGQGGFLGVVIYAAAWGPIFRGVPKIQIALQMSCQQYFYEFLTLHYLNV